MVVDESRSDEHTKARERQKTAINRFWNRPEPKPQPIDAEISGFRRPSGARVPNLNPNKKKGNLHDTDSFCIVQKGQGKQLFVGNKRLLSS